MEGGECWRLETQDSGLENHGHVLAWRDRIPLVRADNWILGAVAPVWEGQFAFKIDLKVGSWQYAAGGEESARVQAEL